MSLLYVATCATLTHTHTHLAVMDVVSSGPAMFAGLFAMLPLEEVVYHGIILGTSSARHTLRDTSTHMHITLELLVTATRTQCLRKTANVIHQS